MWTSSGAGACAVVDGADDGVAHDVATAVTGHRAVGKLVDAMGLLMDMHITLQVRRARCHGSAVDRRAVVTNGRATACAILQAVCLAS